MKKWRNVWPFLGAVFLLTIGNGDWVVTPFVMWLVDSFWAQFFILAVLLNIELVGWYRFWRWFFVSFLPERKKIRTTIDFTKGITTKLKRKGILDEIVGFFEDQFEWAAHPDRWLIKTMKAGGHLLMLFFGAEPFITGGRMAGTIFCATTGFKTGLYSLMVGNCVHVLLSIGLWHLLFYAWEKYRAPLLLSAIISVLFMARGYIWKKLKKNQTEQKSS